MLNTAISLIVCLTELYICYDFCRAFLPKKTVFSNRLYIVLLTTGIGLFHFYINSFHLTFLNLAAFPLVIFAYVTIIFQGSLREKLIYLIFVCAIFYGCDFLFAVLLSIPSYISDANSVMDLSSISWYIFALLLLKHLICTIFKHFSGKTQTYINHKIFFYYLCIPVSSFGIMLLLYYSGIGYHAEAYVKIMLSVYFGIMQFGNFLIFRAFQKYSEELYKNMQQSLIISDQRMKLEHYTKMQTQDISHQEFIHNTSHYIKTIGTLLSEGKLQEVMDILESLNVELEAHVTTLYSDNNVLNSILSEKRMLAAKNDIDMDIYIEPYCNINSISDLDIIAIFSNLIDNALEAAVLCKDKRFVHIRIFTQNDGSFLVIKISNSYAKIPLRIGDAFQSTKNEAGIHGVGLKSVSNTAEKNGGYLECLIEDTQFTVILLLPQEQS
ncbi:MAG: GHKL domain-containing protein [Clostridium sp.]|nr:GHKL domain-containing protein [Clostridium sp.]